MKKPKYVVMTHFDSFYSDSRNARKHLIEQDADACYVYKNNDTADFVCMARRDYMGCILVGTSK